MLDLLYRLMGRVVPEVPAPGVLTQRTRRGRAIHEAAHVLVGELVGSPAAGATIAPVAGDVAGLVWSTGEQPERMPAPLPILSEPLFHRHRPRCFSLAAVRFAGEQGEALAAGFCGDGFFRTGSRDEHDASAFLALGFRGAACGSVPRGGCQLFARELLRRHWGAVHALADALLEHGTIARPAIQAVVDQFGLVPMATFDRPRDPRSLNTREPRALRALRVRPLAPAPCPGCGTEYVPLRCWDRWCVECDRQRRARGQSRRQFLVDLAERVAPTPETTCCGGAP